MGRLRIEDLYNRRVWICYTLKDEIDKAGNLRKTKPGIGPRTGKLKLSLEDATTYQEALDYLAHPNQYAAYKPFGIGLLAVEGIVYIDMDNVLEDGDFSASTKQDLPEFVELVQGLPASTYVEISQSGKGLHVVGLDPDNVASQTRKTVICGRDIGLHKSRVDTSGKVHPQYVALTGKPFQGFGVSEITNISDTVREFFKLLDNRQAPSSSSLVLSSYIDSGEIAGQYPEEISNLIAAGHYSRKWKGDFSALWEGQPIKAMIDKGDSSPSGIDYWLCAKLSDLVVRTKGVNFTENLADVNRLFKLSPHYASKTPEALKKWDRVGRQTCENALNYFLNKNSTREEEREDRQEEDQLKALDEAQDEAARSMDGVLDFITQFSSQPEKPVKTGFENLDALLSGGLYPGLYLFGGVPGAGKTTFLLQLARQILEGNPGRKVLYFGLETSKNEIFGKLLSGFMLEKYGLAFEYRDLTSGILATPDEKSEAIRAAGRALSARLKGNLLAYPQRLEGYAVSSIEGFVKKYASDKAPEARPIVFVDYLQIVEDTRPGANKKSEKEKTDYKAGVFSALAKTYGVPIILVTSLNRASYSSTTGRLQNTSMKESGGLEYACDLSLFLEGQVVNENDIKNGATPGGETASHNIWADPKRKPREDEPTTWNKVEEVKTRFTRIVINKNRLGKTGASAFQFAPAYNAYREDEVLIKYCPGVDEYFSTGAAIFGNAGNPRAYKPDTRQVFSSHLDMW